MHTVKANIIRSTSEVAFVASRVPTTITDRCSSAWLGLMVATSNPGFASAAIEGTL